MLGGDVLISQPAGLFSGDIEDLLQAWGDIYLGGGAVYLRHPPYFLLHPLLHQTWISLQLTQNLGSDAPLLRQQRQKQVFRFYLIMIMSSGQLLGGNDRPLCLLSKLVHVHYLGISSGKNVF